MSLSDKICRPDWIDAIKVKDVKEFIKELKEELSGINFYALLGTEGAGKVKELEDHVADLNTNSTVGIGHTRWATHGEPNDTNAHPHMSESGDLAIIHNGIIENYNPLKMELINRGHTFNTDTDTEVLVHLIEDIQLNEKVELEEAVRLALNQVHGAYAIVILS